jgi:hypothetical protein
MNQLKRAARAKRRAKSMSLVKKGVPHTCSKWSLNCSWKGDGFTLGEWQAARKKARRA